jgi:predicted AAA+ superfamily ATPase
MFIERDITEKLQTLMADERILLLLGARQTGKTTLLRKLKERTEGTTHLFSLEDPLLRAKLNETPEAIFQYIPKPESGRIFLFLDEIQYLNDPSNFLKYIYDIYGDHIKLIGTGSSAFYIDKTFKDSLAGRKRIVTVAPFSFHEFLAAKETPQQLIDALSPLPSALTTARKRTLLTPVRDELGRLMREYLLYGGYPAVVIEQDPEEKCERLQELFQSLLKKDFHEAGIKNEKAFYAILKMLAAQSGSTVSSLELANTVGVSLPTVKNYLYVLQKASIITECRPFSRNVRKELTKMPKYYFNDTGYRNAVLASFRPIDDRLDSGATLETAFFGICAKAGVDPINFWRTQDGREIDFILGEELAFELKMNPTKFSPKQYKRFTDVYPDIPLRPVTWNSETDLDLLDFID